MNKPKKEECWFCGRPKTKTLLVSFSNITKNLPNKIPICDSPHCLEKAHACLRKEGGTCIVNHLCQKCMDEQGITSKLPFLKHKKCPKA